MRAFMLDNSDPESWAVMPTVLRRIWRFCEKYNSSADPAVLTMALRHHFAVDQPKFRACVAVDESGRVVGHALAQISQFYGPPYLEVLQYEVDKPIPEGLVHSTFGSLIGWARFQWKAESIQIAARTPSVARLFRRKFGFESRQTLMRMPMPEIGGYIA